MAAEICGRARGQRHCQVQRRSAHKRKRSGGDGGGAQKSSFFSSSYFKTLDVFFRSAERGEREGPSPIDFPPSVPLFVSQVITEGKTRALPALPGKDLSTPTPSLTAPAFYFPTGRRKGASDSDRK